MPAKAKEPKIPSIDPNNIPKTNLFVLKRNEDETGTSGTGIVGIGILFPSGMCCFEWNSKIRSIGVYNSIADLEAIHGHGGKSIVEWID